MQFFVKIKYIFFVTRGIHTFLDPVISKINEKIFFVKIDPLYLSDIVSQCYDNLNCKKHTFLILLDIRKAFDTVNHNILLNKLNHYGIRGMLMTPTP